MKLTDWIAQVMGPILPIKVIYFNILLKNIHGPTKQSNC